MSFDIGERFRKVWEQQHVFEFQSECHQPIKRNYSFATNPQRDTQYRFNIRIATPPRGQACNAGSGSAYMYRLKAGDMLEAIGPFGEFHIKSTLNEMIYIGGGSGMAPLKSHISYLFDTFAHRPARQLLVRRAVAAGSVLSRLL